MEHEAAEQTPTALRLGRHAVGIMVLALANPLIYFGSDKVLTWAVTWAPALIAAAVLYALYSLFFTKRAKAAWPGSAIALAWVLLALLIVGNWVNYQEARSRPRVASTIAPVQPSASPQTPRPSTYEEAAAPPSIEAAAQWTQENTGSSEKGPWLEYAPKGTRFCRLANGTIVNVYPPGVKPDAEKANPFCASDSVASPNQL